MPIKTKPKPEEKGWAGTAQDLFIALEESLKLQSHYAELLNMHDGGERIGFKTVPEWLARLRLIGKLPSEMPGASKAGSLLDRLILASQCYLMAVHNFRTALKRFGGPGGFDKFVDKHQAALIEALEKAKNHEHHNQR